MNKQNTTYVLDTERTYAELESASENKVIKQKLFKIKQNNMDRENTDCISLYKF